MARMNSVFLMGLLLIGAGCSGCAGLNARQKVLLPTMQVVWPNVRVTAERGVEALPPEGRTEALATLDLFGAALTAGTEEGIAHVHPSWIQISAWADNGIDARVEAKEIGPGVALSLKERVRQFNDALAEFLHQGKDK